VDIINITNPAVPQITGTVDFEGLVEDVHIGRNLVFCGAMNIFAGIDASNLNNPTLYGYYDLLPFTPARAWITDVWSKDDSIGLAVTTGGLFIFRTGYVGFEEVKIGSSTKKISLLSNPAKERIRLALDGRQTYSITIYDVSGRLKKDLTVSGKERLELSTTGLSTGVYILQVQNATECFKKSIIILSN